MQVYFKSPFPKVLSLYAECTVTFIALIVTKSGTYRFTMNNEIQNELKKIYKLTGIKLNIENEDEIELSDLKKISLAYREKYSGTNLFYDILSGVYPYSEQLHALKALQIKPDSKMRLYLIHVPSGIDDSIEKIITSLYPGKNSEYLCILDSSHLCFLYLGEDNR